MKCKEILICGVKQADGQSTYLCYPAYIIYSSLPSRMAAEVQGVVPSRLCIPGRTKKSCENAILDLSVL
jgi:hypothetical protein